MALAVGSRLGPYKVTALIGEGGRPPAVRIVLEHCLEKDQRKRIADLSTALVLIERDTSESIDAGERTRLIQTRFSDTNGEVSPNGRWLAYQSNESGRHEIHVRPFPDVERSRHQVSTAGGVTPLWLDELQRRVPVN